MWIKRCNQYFKLCKIPDDQKVDLASLNMFDKAENWLSSYLAIRPTIDWNEFMIDVSNRFKDDVGCHVVEKFNRLQQSDSLESYIDEFENLRSLMLQQSQFLPESYFLDSFIGGLKPSLKPFVRAFKPNSISSAVEYARLQEEAIQAIKPTWKPTPVSSQIKPTSKPLPALLPTPNIPPIAPIKAQNPSYHTTSANKPVFRTLTPAERREKQAKGLCFFCDQPYDGNHKCPFKQTQLFTVEIPASEGDDSGSDVDDKEPEFLLPDVEPHISVNALSGNQAFQTMRVNGLYNQTPLHILIDSGSTHNFLDLGVAKKLSLTLEPISPQAVTVADGNHLACQYVCKNFSWRMHNVVFTSDVLIIPLGGCDMVLGVQWLSELGTVKWDFKKLMMEFEFQGSHFVLKGLPPKSTKLNNQLSAKSMEGATQLYFLQLIPPGSDEVGILNFSVESGNVSDCIQ
ncbi:Retrotransposon-derived protein PEG10 [Bienertia sinuspersici]